MELNKKNDRGNSVALLHFDAPSKVEVAGVEPASKLGTQKLSTRLFCD